MAHLPKPGSEVSRDRVLTDAELAQVFKNTSKLRPAPYGPMFQLLILTSARRTEIAALRWSEIKDDTIILPRDRTKTGQVHSIPLAPQTLAILKQLPRIGPSDFVFTVTSRNSVDFSGSKRRLDGITKIPPWRIHDLRRTCATGLQRLGINLQVIEAVLGHVGGSRSGIVGVYQRHSFDAEKRTALEAWAREVERIVDGKPAKVLPLRRR
jgi:integrase